MLIEQAFYHLPEILVGSKYPTQDYESGIVSAFCLALLQQLNGRNALNPLSFLHTEKPYKDKQQSWTDDNGAARYLRADLHFDSHRLEAGNKRLAAYGWRHSNWLEAKFFRAYDAQGKPARSTNQAVQTAALLADVLRLAALGRREIGKDVLSFSSRYLLHVYLREISEHLCIERNTTAAARAANPVLPKRVSRAWLQTLTSPGHQSKVSIRIGDETKTIRKNINSNLNDVTLEFAAENLVIKPTLQSEDDAVFACYLSRLTEFKVTFDGHTWGIGPDRKEIKSSDNAYEAIREHVGKYINTKGDVEQHQPEDDEPEPAAEEPAQNGNAAN